VDTVDHCARATLVVDQNVTVMRFSAPSVVSPVGWDSATVKASLPSRASSSRRVIRTCFEVSSTAKFNIAEAAK
jgi:uncharacterized protein YaaW (UPF0174 family)